MHWAVGAIGYFSTYALGNVISGPAVGAGDGRVTWTCTSSSSAASSVRSQAWLQQTPVVGTGASSPRAELIERTTGGGLDPEPYLRYLRGKYPLAA